MRIAIFAPVFVRPTETFIYDATSELQKSGADLIVLTEARQITSDRPFEPVFEVPRTSRFNIRRLAMRALQVASASPSVKGTDNIQQAAIRQHLDRFRPDVILANYGQGGVLVSTVARQLQIPLVVSFHGADASRRARNPVWQEKYRAMFQIASAVTGPSYYVCDKLIALGCPRERVHRLHYGIRTDQLAHSPLEPRRSGDSVDFLFVGRLSPKKDPLTLLRCFDKARNRLKPMATTLTMIGDGPLRPDVASLIDELNLGDCVRMLGQQPHHSVIEHYRTAHIYVQHSVTAPDGDEEGLPVSITEALAAGLPVVSTRHSGIPEAVRHGENGYLVNEGDIESMSDYMIALAEEPNSCEKFGKAGRSLLETEFDMPIVQKQLRKILSDVSGVSF